jgi:hypothetical protein
MNERMSDLLDLASDDEGAPLGFDGDAVVRRARVRRRRRHGSLAVGVAAASVAGVLGVTQLLGTSRPDAGPGPTVGPTTPAPTVSSPSAQTLTPQERAIVDRCSHASTPPPPSPTLSEQNPETTTDRGTVVKSGSSGRPATFLHDWTLDAHAQDAQGVTATFVDPDHTRWASCQLADGGSRMDNEVVPMGRVPTGPIPRNWFGPEGFRHHSLAPAWAQVCTPSEGQICARELFAGAFPRYADVASARVEAPDGTALTPVFGDYTYVFRHTETRVDPHRAANDSQPLPSMPVTLLGDNGKQIIRYDYFPSYIIPDSCPDSGGC